MSGIGGDCFKARYKRPDRGDWHCVKAMPWRNMAEEAQADLDDYAAKKNMKVVFG